MSTSSKDQLFRLIKTLTKAEKRHFRLYANRTMGQQERKFLRLFDVMDRMDNYDEEELIARLSGSERSHLPHLKRHLYRQLLISLRLVHIQRNIDIEIREQLDFARVLYSKGLYMESLKILERCRSTAEDNHQDILQLEILDFQNNIEARHITRSRQVSRKMDKLLIDATHRSEMILVANELSNLNIQIQGYYIDYGHTRSEEELHRLNQAWQEMQPLPKRVESIGTFFEKVNRFQAHMWLNYIRLDLYAASENAAEWVILFRLYPQMRDKDPDLYMRGLYYLLLFCFLLDDLYSFSRYLDEFHTFVDNKADSFMPASNLLAFQYLSQQTIRGMHAQFIVIPPMGKVVDYFVKTTGCEFSEDVRWSRWIPLPAETTEEFRKYIRPSHQQILNDTLSGAAENPASLLRPLLRPHEYTIRRAGKCWVLSTLKKDEGPKGTRVIKEPVLIEWK